MPGLVWGKLRCNMLGVCAARDRGAGKDMPLVRVGGKGFCSA